MELKNFFSSNEKYALGFSGGADSAFLLWAAVKSGADVNAYYVKTQFQPDFELRDARMLCDELKVELRLIELDILASAEVAQNPPDRCYRCKKLIFSAIAARAAQDGCTVIIDGTNASDDVDDRPGMRALRELSVRSPLRECGISKPELRRLSHEAGLFTWDKPAYACLATRVPCGERISAQILERVEKAENELFAMGFTDFRVRTVSGAARLQFPEGQLQQAVARQEEIFLRLRPYFENISIDPNGRNNTRTN